MKLTEWLEKEDLKTLRGILYCASSWRDVIKDKERFKELTSEILELTQEVNEKLCEIIINEKAND